jgi:COP9 signalosome complex subunit 7
LKKVKGESEPEPLRGLRGIGFLFCRPGGRLIQRGNRIASQLAQTMEVEQKQADLVQQFVLLAGSARGRAAVELITHATSHPQLFAFSELLSAPHIAELKGTEHSSALDLLRLFAHGTWSDYRNNAQLLPQLDSQQELKLKQLTVMTLAETSKVLPYDLLMQQLDISNVRELEDLLINDCMYCGIVRGKLDQRRRCFEVQFAAGRDLRPGQLDNMIATLANWLGSSDNLLLTIQEKIKWADSMSEQDRRHKKEVEDKAEEIRKSIKAEMEIRGQQDVVYSEAGALGALVMDFVEEDRSRPKRRR